MGGSKSKQSKEADRNGGGYIGLSAMCELMKQLGVRGPNRERRAKTIFEVMRLDENSRCPPEEFLARSKGIGFEGDIIQDSDTGQEVLQFTALPMLLQGWAKEVDPSYSTSEKIYDVHPSYDFVSGDGEAIYDDAGGAEYGASGNLDNPMYAKGGSIGGEGSAGEALYDNTGNGENLESHTRDEQYYATEEIPFLPSGNQMYDTAASHPGTEVQRQLYDSAEGQISTPANYDQLPGTGGDDICTSEYDNQGSERGIARNEGYEYDKQEAVYDNAEGDEDINSENESQEQSYDNADPAQNNGDPAYDVAIQ